VDYVSSKRLDKPLVALGIIREWRSQDPPGRFLKVDERTGLWNDVGDKKAREKTSQALREKAPEIRKPNVAGGGRGKGGVDRDSPHEGDYSVSSSVLLVVTAFSSELGAARAYRYSKLSPSR
jgi:hypothetical protein